MISGSGQMTTPLHLLSGDGCHGRNCNADVDMNRRNTIMQTLLDNLGRKRRGGEGQRRGVGEGEGKEGGWRRGGGEGEGKEGCWRRGGERRKGQIGERGGRKE